MSDSAEVFEVGSWVNCKKSWGRETAVLVRKAEDFLILRYAATRHSDGASIWVLFTESKENVSFKAPADDEGRRIASLTGPYGEGYLNMPPQLPEIPPIAPVKAPFEKVADFILDDRSFPPGELSPEESKAWLEFLDREYIVSLSKAGWTPEEYEEALRKRWGEEDVEASALPVSEPLYVVYMKEGAEPEDLEFPGFESEGNPPVKGAAEEALDEEARQRKLVSEALDAALLKDFSNRKRFG